MATHSSVLAWRIPGTRESGGLPSMGSHRVGHSWSNLAAAGTLSISPGKGRMWFSFRIWTLRRAWVYSVIGLVAALCHPVILLGVWVDTHMVAGWGDRAYLYGLRLRLNSSQGKEQHPPRGLLLIQQLPTSIANDTWPSLAPCTVHRTKFSNRQQNLKVKSMAFGARLPGLDFWTDGNFLYLSFPIIKGTWSYKLLRSVVLRDEWVSHVKQFTNVIMVSNT